MRFLRHLRTFSGKGASFPLCNCHPRKANFLFALSPCSSNTLIPSHPVSSFSISNIVLKELWKRGIQCVTVKRTKSYHFQPAACYLKLNGFSLWCEKPRYTRCTSEQKLKNERSLCVLSCDNEIKNEIERNDIRCTWDIESHATIVSTVAKTHCRSELRSTIIWLIR